MLFALSLLVTFLLLIVVFRAQFLEAVAAPLVENDGPQKADAALVLGGDGWATRILRAGALVRGGYVPYAYISGPQAYGGHESDFTIAYAVREGFPAAYFHGEPNDCLSTRMEAEKFGALFRQQHLHHILLVTSNYHTHRAASIFRKQNPWLKVTVIAADDPDFSVQTWWKTRDGRKIFLMEWTKTVAAWLGL